LIGADEFEMCVMVEGMADLCLTYVWPVTQQPTCHAYWMGSRILAMSNIGTTQQPDNKAKQQSKATEIKETCVGGDQGHDTMRRRQQQKQPQRQQQ
jgi:hypothetical protein